MFQPPAMRTYGKAKNISQQSGPFSAQAYNLEAAKMTENYYAPNVASELLDTDAAAKKRKTSENTHISKKLPSMSLEKSIHLGHDDDVNFLLSQTEGNGHNLASIGILRVGFIFPENWKVERIDRCGAWLKESLGFKSFMVGGSFAYTHETKAMEFRSIARKEMEERNAATAAAAAMPSPQYTEEPVIQSRHSSLTSYGSRPSSLTTGGSRPASLTNNGSRPTSLTIHSVPSTDSQGGGSRNSGSKRPFKERSYRDGVDSDSDDNDNNFSPRSGRSSRSSMSPFFSSQPPAAPNTRSPRGAPSPADAGLMGFTRLGLENPASLSAEYEPRMTRSRNNSVNVLSTRSRASSDTTPRPAQSPFPFGSAPVELMRTDTVVTSAVPETDGRIGTRNRNTSQNQLSSLSRSRGNSDGESLSAKSRNGSVDLGRCQSRSGPAILEESQEDLEDEDSEVIALITRHESSGSFISAELSAAPVGAPSGIASTSFAAEFFSPSRQPRPASRLREGTATPPLPQFPRSFNESEAFTNVDGEEAVDIASDADTMRDSDEDRDEDFPLSPPSGGGGASSGRSHTPPAVLFSPAYGSIPNLSPHEMSAQSGAVMSSFNTMLSGNSPPSAAVVRRASAIGVSGFPEPRQLPSGPYARYVPAPGRPVRPKPQHQLARAATAPLPEIHQASPSATVPVMGLGGNQLYTPQAIRVADIFPWESSIATVDRVLCVMRTNFTESVRNHATRPPLMRAKSEGNSSSSPSDTHWDPDFVANMHSHSNRNSSFGIRNPFGGRDSSMGGGGMGAYPFQALTSDRNSSASHLLTGLCGDDDHMHMHMMSPLQSATHWSLSSSGNSTTFRNPSPGAFSSVSPKHSPGSLTYNMHNSVHAHAHTNNSYHTSTSMPNLNANAGTSSTMNVDTYTSSFTPLFMNNNRLSETYKAKKRQSSVAKLRRMSIATAHSTHALLPTLHETSMDASYLGSPQPKSKCLSDTKSRHRRSSIFMKEPVVEAPEEHSFASHHSGCDSNMHMHLHNTSDTTNSSSISAYPSDHRFFHPTSRLNELNFKGIVIGGVYQHCFDNASPLVAAPTGSDRRVVDITIHADNSLTLSLYQPREKTTTSIELGVHWQWMRCSPTGYLAFRNAIEPKKKTVCYFLPKHPDDWNTAKNSSSSNESTSNNYYTTNVIPGRNGHNLRNRRVSIVPQHEYNYPHRQSMHNLRSLDMDQPLARPSTARAVDPTAMLAIDDDGYDQDDDEYNKKKNTSMRSDSGDAEDADESVHVMDDDVDLPNMNDLGLDDSTSEKSEHWSNANILALLFDFLIDDAVLFGRPSGNGSGGRSTASSSSRPSQRRRANVNTTDSALQQLQAIQTVSKTFALATYMVIAQRKSSLVMGHQLSFDFSRYKKFSTKFQHGMYLSEGVCKNVYCVLNPATANLEAVSVMDIDDLKSRNMDVAITQELKISLLCSALVNLKICPNLVQVYSLFQSDFDAPMKQWSTKRSFEEMKNCINNLRPSIELRKSDVTGGSFQYIRMEFCSGGDVEDRVRAVALPDLYTVRSMFFQMCFSLYSCREKLCMRHFDIKLLNFFVTTSDILHYRPSSAKTVNNANNVNTDTNLQIGLGQYVYNLHMPPNALTLIKLADFGTSAVGTAGLGDCITMQQFTTLENTPPEFLLLGSFARQSYAADTFPLGLCLLHLLTGYMPYEELLKDVHCPPHLASRLRKQWLTEDPSSPYYLIHEVVMTLDTACEDGSASEEEPEGVLLDTLYRYMVLFGLSESFSHEQAACSVYADSPIWTILFDALDLRSLHAEDSDTPFKLNTSKKMGGGLSAKEECAAQFKRDAQLWSMHIGSHRTMQDFRQRLGELGDGAAELMESLVHFDPARRCTMYDALQHSVFASLRLDPRQTAATLHAAAHGTDDHGGSGHFDGACSTVRYLHYYRGQSQLCTPTSGRSHMPSFNVTHNSQFFDALPIL